MGARRETARLAKVGTHFVVERAVAAFNAVDGDVDVVADAISLCFECVKMRAYNLWNADNSTEICKQSINRGAFEGAHKIFFYFNGSTSFRALLDDDESEVVSRCDD